MANDALGQAKAARNDEFYTQYHDIENEVNAYLEYNGDTFRGKTVLLPCDDPEWSNFTKYFAESFVQLGLKKLISTSFALNEKRRKYGLELQPPLFEQESAGFDEAKATSRGKLFVLDETNARGADDWDHMRHAWRYLGGTGDFASDEVCALRDEADMIITNPPFSLFREFVAWIRAAPTPKQFLIIGNMNAITYKEIFPLIKENQMWLGATGFVTDMVFGVPEGTVVREADKAKAAKLGYVGNYTRLGNSCWFTNIEHARRHEPLQLMSMADNLKHNDKVKGYPRYDNYDAIEVCATKAIPSDYDGVMGVPISFLDSYDPEQFEILGATQRGCHDLVPDTRKYDDYREMTQAGRPTGSSGSKTNENANLLQNDGRKNYFVNSEGRIVQSAYQRIFIRHRRDEGGKE